MQLTTTTGGSRHSKLKSSYSPMKNITASTLCLLLLSGLTPAGAQEAQTQPIEQTEHSQQTLQIQKTDTKDGDSISATKKIIAKPGIPITVTTETEDLVPTDDPELAKKQVLAYPDSAEASFIYAVALTRTSRVEEALKEIRRARRLAEKEGGPAYFDKMIASYEEMVKNYPDENRVRYGLAWAYYMKAYLVARQSKKDQENREYLEKLRLAQQAKVEGKQEPVAQQSQNKPTSANWLNAWAVPYMSKDQNGNAVKLPELKTGADAPHLKGALELASPSVVPQVKAYYQKALDNLDELIKRKPDDVWAIAYRAHLNLEYTGDLDSSMAVWQSCAQRFPDNPAAYFFLGEGYLKKGNLKECLSNISRAIALRGLSK